MHAYICVTYAHDDRMESDLFCRGLARYGFRYSCVNELSDPHRRRELVRNGELLLALISPAAAEAETVAADIRQALELGMSVLCVCLEAGELEGRFCAGAEGGAILIPYPAEDTPDRHGRSLFVHRLFVRHLSRLQNCFVENVCTEDEYGRVIRCAVHAHAGQGKACYVLGKAYEQGVGVPLLEKEAAFWMAKAAAEDIPDALLSMGQMRLNGAGVERDPEEAFRLFTRVLELGDIRGLYHCGLCYLEGRGVVKDPVYAAECLKTAAEAGYAPALYRMGILHRDGVGVEAGTRRAMQYLYAVCKQEAEERSSSLMSLFGREGKRYACVTMRQFRRLRSLHTEQEISGDTDSARKSRYRCLGRNRILRDDFPEDIWDATLEELYDRTSEENSEAAAPFEKDIHYAAEAAFVLGQLLTAGCEEEGLHPSPTRALVWYRYAARMGHTEALYALGEAYRKGMGTPAVPARAATLFRLAADAGNVLSQFAFGVCCEQGIGMEINHVLAARYYQMAAEAGYPPAQNNLGGCYERGVGVVQNILTAVEWYAAAAHEGQPDGICRLGICYETGRGVTADMDKALRLYREAAEKGHPYACYRLALCYDRGVQGEEEEAEIMMTEDLSAGRSLGESLDRSSDQPSVADATGMAGQTDVSNGSPKDGTSLVGVLKAVSGDAAPRLRRDRARAMALYRCAAEGGVAYGAYALYLCHRLERGAYRDPSAELEYLKDSARAGCLQAAYELGLCYMDGVGTPVDPGRAIRCFSRAANLWRAHVRDIHWHARAMDTDGLPPDGLSLKQAAGGALYMLGYCALYGSDDGGIQNPTDQTALPSRERLERATALFREAADIQHVGSLVMLGDLYAYGLLRSETGDSEDKALGYYLAAVHTEKDTYTRGMALREQTDTSVDARMSLAKKALRVALAEEDEGNAELARVNAWRSLSDAAERGSVDALVGMAECLLRGSGAPKNPAASIRLLQRAECAKGGRMIASLWLGDALQSRWSELNDPDRADAVYLRGLHQPCLESECGLHTLGLRRAERKQADERARTELLYRLAVLRALHFSDAGGYRDAFPYLAEAVLCGHKGAEEDLARMFAYEMNRPKGSSVKAKRGKRSRSLLPLGRNRLRRRIREKQSALTKQNRAQWIHRSWMTDYYQALWPEPIPFAYEMRPTSIPADRPAFAIAPVTDAMRVNALQYLGECYFEGYGVPVNPEAAVSCYRTVLDIARAGKVDSVSVTEATYSLGWCLLYGIGVTANRPEAIRLLTAASRSHSGACYTLGLCHEQGIGVVVADDREAVRFYRKAQRLGHPKATEKIRKLEKRLSARLETSS